MQTDHATTAAEAARPGGLAALLRSSVVRYLVVGGLSFGVDAGILVALHEGQRAPLLVATTVAFWSALLFNFTLNRLWAFGGNQDVKVSFVKYLALVGANYLATIAIVSAGTRLGAHYVAAKAFATATTVCWNYLAYRFWVFR